MSIQMWQIIEVKKALAVFCKDNAVGLSDGAAIEATHRLLKIAEEGAKSSSEMLAILHHAEDQTENGASNLRSALS